MHFVQLLVNQQRQKCQKKHPRADAEYAHGEREPADFGQQFGLFFLHVGICVIEKELIILVHGESRTIRPTAKSPKMPPTISIGVISHLGRANPKQWFPGPGGSRRKSAQSPGKALTAQIIALLARLRRD